MQSSNAEPTNPLGLNLDFIFGRGYLWAERERLSDWITLELLRMEIPDLAFPFDARGGLTRFRNTRCLVREIEIGISEVGLGDLLRQAAAELDQFQDLQVRFLADAVHISVRLEAMGVDSWVSFRAALVPPEPARADQIHLSLYDYRAFGPLPFPARLVAFELMTGLLNTQLLRPPGRGQSFTVGVAGDILSFRPLKLILLHIFAAAGWKLPNLSDIVLDGARIRPGALTIRASSRDATWRQASARDAAHTQDFQLARTREGARALGAYEAKDLFIHADQALFDGQVRQALDTLSGYRDVYGLHSELVSRTLDCLLADPTAANLAEASALCRELEAQNPDDLRALLARPTLTLVSNPGNVTQLIADLTRLSGALSARGDTPDWILSELSLAAHLTRAGKLTEACAHLGEVLKISPRERVALEKLRDLYTRLDEPVGLEDVLKRLTGVYTDRAALKDTYLRLANLLMARNSAAAQADTTQLNPPQIDTLRANPQREELREARLYLEKVLRLDPSALDALNTLGESYVMSDEPLRALKAFGSAARAAENDGHPQRAARLLLRVARLWAAELHNDEQALMSCRRALNLLQNQQNPAAYTVPGGVSGASDAEIDLLELAAQACTRTGLLAEASDYWLMAIPLLEAGLERAEQVEKTAPPPVYTTPGTVQTPTTRARARLVDAHRQLAEIYRQRGRDAAAEPHHERIRALDPHAFAALFAPPPAAALDVQNTAPPAVRHADEPIDPQEFYDLPADPSDSTQPDTAPRALDGSGSPESPESPEGPESTETPDSTEPNLDDFRRRYRELFLAKKAEITRNGEVLDEKKRENATNSPKSGGFSRDDEKTAQYQAIPEHFQILDATRRGASADNSDSSDNAEARLREAVARARSEDDPSALIQALDALIAAHDDPASPIELSAVELARLSLEAGELNYYDIEDIAAARVHLERARDLDPQGLGAQPTLLTTLEAIYEETGALDERIRVLQQRLHSADSPEMRITYRLLIAQLIWDAADEMSWMDLDASQAEPVDVAARAQQARRWLDEVLELDAQNEAAHRLLAQICERLEDYEQAARHLKSAIQVAGGGLDAIEMERELADLLLEQLDRPDQARLHFERVLQAAPGDSIALERIKDCQARVGDWPGYIQSLGRELGLLIGQPAGIGLGEMIALEPAQVSQPLRIAASQIIADAARVTHENLDAAQDAWALWGQAFALWPEHVDALEQRLALDRMLDKSRALAQDLESYAELLLDSHQRFDALTEAARLYAGPLGHADLARPLLAEAVALVQDEDNPPDGLDQARRALSALQADGDL